jgi:hypothetical protein
MQRKNKKEGIKTVVSWLVKKENPNDGKASLSTMGTLGDMSKAQKHTHKKGKEKDDSVVSNTTPSGYRENEIIGHRR